MGLVDALVAIVAGLGAIISAVAGVLLIVRAVRSRERRAAAKELELTTELLANERHARVLAEARAYRMEIELARHGVVWDDSD